MDWYFLSTQRVTDPLLDLLITWFLVDISGTKEGTDNLAVSLIWETNDADFGHGRVLQETLFDLSREDVFAA